MNDRYLVEMNKTTKTTKWNKKYVTNRELSDERIRFIGLLIVISKCACTYICNSNCHPTDSIDFVDYYHLICNRVLYFILCLYIGSYSMHIFSRTICNTLACISNQNGFLSQFLFIVFIYDM